MKSLWPFAALSASYFAHVGFFNPYLSLWLKELGYGVVAIGLFTSMQSLTRLYAPYAWGWLSDRTGHRVWLLRYAATASLMLSFGLNWTTHTGWLAVVMLLLFTHTSAMMPMSESALVQHMADTDGFDAKRYGRVRLWGSLGFLVTVTAAGAWFEGHGMRSFAWWSSATLGLLVISVWRMPDVRDRQADRTHVQPMGPVLRQPAVRWFLLSVFGHVLAHMWMYVFYSLYLDELGYDKTTIGALWAVSVVVEIVWFAWQGRLMPRLSPARWLMLAAALTCVRMVITASAGPWWWAMLLAQLAHAVTFAAHHTVCMGELARHFPGALRARGQAVYAIIGYGLSGVSAGLLGGWISRWVGLGGVFWCGAATSAVAVWAALRYEHALALGNEPSPSVTRTLP